MTYGPRQIGFFSHDSDDYGVYYRSPSLEIDALCTFTCPSAYRKLSSTSQVTCPAGHLKLEDGASHAFCVERRCNDTSGTISFVFSFSLSSWNVVFINSVTQSLIFLLFAYSQIHQYFADLSQHVMMVRMITMDFDVNVKRVRLGLSLIHI